MGYFDRDGGAYGIPPHGIYVENHLEGYTEGDSKYFNLIPDTEVGIHLGSMEDMRRQYIETVCNGVPWPDPS